MESESGYEKSVANGRMEESGWLGTLCPGEPSGNGTPHSVMLR